MPLLRPAGPLRQAPTWRENRFSPSGRTAGGLGPDSDRRLREPAFHGCAGRVGAGLAEHDSQCVRRRREPGDYDWAEFLIEAGELHKE